MNTYEIKFLTKKNGKRNYLIHLEAANKSEAIEKAKGMWYGDHTAHMFYIESRRISPDEVINYTHWFRAI